MGEKLGWTSGTTILQVQIGWRLTPPPVSSVFTRERRKDSEIPLLLK